MSTATPIPEAFARLERRLQTLRSMHAQGRLTDAQLQEEIQKLTVTDDQGRSWWLAGESGAWHLWDGQAWVLGQPGRSRAQVAKPMRAGRAIRRGGRLAALGCAALLVVSLIAGGVFLGGGYAEYQASPKIVEEVQAATVGAAPLPLPSDQQAARAERGDPEAFLMLFYKVPVDDGSVGDVRTETWSYYTEGVEYTFINGEKVGEAPMEIEVGELAGLPYRPEPFQAYMSLEEVVAAAGLDAFLLVPLEKELVEGGEVYYADRLTFGLKDGELRYIEALALEAATSGSRLPAPARSTADPATG